MKLSFSLFFTAYALKSVSAFVPTATASTDLSLKATVAGLIPPKAIKDLETADLYDENVQKTYG